MVAAATLNVRLPEDLKERGMQVLEREGISVSDAVRELFCELEKEQSLPSFMREKIETSRWEEMQRKREVLRSMVGVVCVPEGYDARSAWQEHLEKKHG